MEKRNASSEELEELKLSINNNIEELIIYKQRYIRLDKDFASELKTNHRQNCCVYINPMEWFKV